LKIPGVVIRFPSTEIAPVDVGFELIVTSTQLIGSEVQTVEFVEVEVDVDCEFVVEVVEFVVDV